MNRIIIRKAKFSELSRITAITKWAYRALNKNATLITKPHEPKELNEQFQKKEFFVLVCLVNGKIIGAVRYFFDENNNLYFFKLAVLKTYRSLGAGTLLIKAVEGAAIKKGSKKIFLDCAKKPDNRPQFSELINLIKRGKIQGVICWKIDRLSRNPIDSATIQWLLQQNELKIIQTMERQYLPGDNALLFNVESGMANQYILDLSKNVKRGIRAKLEKGGWPNLAPLGYLNKDSKIIIDKARGKYIIKIFEMYKTGKYSVKEIADILFKEGFRSRAHNKYHKSKIHKMLSESFYCGIMEKSGNIYQGNHEPLISKKLFDEVQEMLTKKSHIKKQNIPFAFRGMLRCAKCGCLLTATKKKGRLTYYYCTNGKNVCEEHKAYIKEENLSTELNGVFDNLIFDEKVVNLVYRAKQRESGNVLSYLEEAILGLQNRLKTLEERKKVLIDGYLDKVVLEGDYKAKNQIIENEIVLINKDLQELEIKKSSQDNITLERIRNAFLEPKTMQKEFLSQKPDEQRNTLIDVLWNATIDNKKIANISFKEPYNVLSKIENKSDFNSVRRGWDALGMKLL
ncbi:MAG: GNAT family N-acetyltransferase [Candidatus Falkowbacteria bacterium]